MCINTIVCVYLTLGLAYRRAFPGGSVVKNLPAMREPQAQPLGWEDPLRRAWQLAPVFSPGESHGQRIRGAIFPRVAKKVKVKFLSCVRFFVTPWIVAYQASPSMEFSRQEYQSGLPFPSPGDLPDPGIEPPSPTLQEKRVGHNWSDLARMYFVNCQGYHENQKAQLLPQGIASRSSQQQQVITMEYAKCRHSSRHGLFGPGNTISRNLS